MKQEMALLCQIRKLPKDCTEVTEYVREMNVLNQSYIQSALQAVSQEESEKLGEILKNYRKLRRVIASIERTERENFDYECGIFTGAYKVLMEIEESYETKRVQRHSAELMKKKHVADVVSYLYKNSDARQIDIAENVGVRPNHLSDVLNRLMDANYVEKYRKSKGTRYNLTKAGRAIYRVLNQKERVPDVYIEGSCREVSEKKKFLETIAAEGEKSYLKKENKYAKWEKDIRNHTEYASSAR